MIKKNRLRFIAEDIRYSVNNVISKTTQKEKYAFLLWKYENVSLWRFLSSLRWDEALRLEYMPDQIL